MPTFNAISGNVDSSRRIVPILDGHRLTLKGTYQRLAMIVDGHRIIVLRKELTDAVGTPGSSTAGIPDDEGSFLSGLLLG